MCLFSLKDNSKNDIDIPRENEISVPTPASETPQTENSNYLPLQEVVNLPPLEQNTDICIICNDPPSENNTKRFSLDLSMKITRP